MSLYIIEQQPGFATCLTPCPLNWTKYYKIQDGNVINVQVVKTLEHKLACWKGMGFIYLLELFYVAIVLQHDDVLLH